MKFSAAAFTLLLSLCHSVVNGVISNPPSLRGGGGDQESTPLSGFPIGQQHVRRLEEGGYIVVFDNTVEDVEEFAIVLSNYLGKRPDYVMKNTIHGVYMTGLSDADVEYLNTLEGVSFIEQNHFLNMFEGMPPQEQEQDQEDEISTKSLAADKKAEVRQKNRRRRRRRRNPVPAPVPSPTPPQRSPYIFPDSPPTQEPPSIPNRQLVPWNIERVKGPKRYTGNNKAWILDTGILLNHPDLNVDKVNAYNVYTGTNAANDDNGHGTQCAGIVAAIDNDIGTVGVASGATVVPIKVFDASGSGSFAAVVAGVDYVASKAKRGDVANLSLGGASDSALDRAVIALAAKGVFVTIAAGNSYVDAQNTSPARVVANNVYTISSMNQSGRFSGFSNFGSVVDFACPGEGFRSTHINGDLTTGNIAGTSFAAPHAAGVFLLGNPSTDGVVAYDPDGNNDPCLVNGA